MDIDKLKKEVWTHFQEYQLVFLTTCYENHPNVRPVMLIRLDGELYVSAKATRPHVKQISNNPRIEFCLELGNIMNSYDGVGYVRVECNAEILNRMSIKEKIYHEIGFIKNYYNDFDDYLKRGTIIHLQPLVVRYMAPDTWKIVKIIL